MNRATSFALVVVICASAVSAQAATPKGKMGIRKPVGVMKGPSGGFNFGNVTNPIINTPPKAAPGFPYNPTGLHGGHGPVVLNPPKHGPINGLPVPYKPQPVCGCHHHCDRDFCREWSMWCMSMGCADECGNCSDDSSDDMSNVTSTDTSDDTSSDTDSDAGM
jgi:hypothetical protein